MTRQLGLIALLLISASGAPVTAQAAEGAIGSVIKLDPEAYGTPPGGERSPLRLDAPVVTDETVETSDTGSLHLRFIDETDLWLDGQSQLVLDKLVFDPGSNDGAYAVQLSVGLFRFVTGKLPPESYEVRTPTAVIAVRGADFVVSVAPSGATRLTVYEGRLTVRPRLGGSSVSVGPPSTAMVARATGPAMASPFVDPVGMPVASLVDRPAPEIEAVKLQGVNDVGIGQGPGRQRR